MDKKKIVFLLFVNTALTLLIIYLLNFFGVIKTKSPFKKESVEKTTNDPFLLEKESLQKQWSILSAKENSLSEQKNSLNNQKNLLQDKIKEVDKQLSLTKNIQKKMKDSASQSQSQESNLRSLASKVTNVPPKDGALMLADMDANTAIDVLRMMDKIALEKKTQSTSAYLISLMPPAKRKSIINLLAAYPSNIDSLED